jgi:hypothetical protein
LTFPFLAWKKEEWMPRGQKEDGEKEQAAARKYIPKTGIYF